MFRNTPHGKPQWARPIEPDMTPENIAWKAFLGEAPQREFDANRYLNWRFFWDYSGGNFYENMSHALAFWYKVLNLQIPSTVTASGGIYLWKDGREVPDTMSVSMRHCEEILFTWDSAFGNSELGVAEDLLGTDGTISRGTQASVSAAKGESSGWDRDGRSDPDRGERSHAELSRLHTVGQAAELSPRSRFPDCHSVPDGSG